MLPGVVTPARAGHHSSLTSMRTMRGTPSPGGGTTTTVGTLTMSQDYGATLWMVLGGSYVISGSVMAAIKVGYNTCDGGDKGGLQHL